MKKIVCIWIVVFLSIILAGAEEIYKWVDEKGITHYTDTPPPEKQNKDIDTVKEEKGVSRIGAPTIPPAKTQPTTTSATTSSPTQVDVWVDEYGNQHPITPELIVQEKEWLENNIKEYEHDRTSATEGGKKWYDYVIEETKKDLKVLEKSPRLYFATKHERDKRKLRDAIRDSRDSRWR